MPKISVVMPVYNSEKYLPQAVESILTQTFADFEFLIVDDCSTDGTAQILADYAQRDPRIKVFHQQHNLGVAGALNVGCRQAQGELIARMDADDVSLPTRFETQVRFLDDNPEIVAVGSWVKVIDADDRMSGMISPPTNSNVVRWKLITENCLIHPTVMFRRAEVAEQSFYKIDIPGQDYELWARLSLSYPLANLSEVLLYYRRWEGNVTSQRRHLQKQATTEIIHFLCAYYLNAPISMSAADGIRAVTWNEPINDKIQIAKSARLLEQVYRNYLRSFQLSRSDLQSIREDVAVKFYALGKRGLKLSPFQALCLILKGFLLSPKSARIAADYYWNKLVHKFGAEIK